VNGGLPRTLVVHTGGIGDFLLTCPALRLLAEDGPVELLGRPSRLALGIAGGIAEAVHDIDSVGFESLFSEPNSRIRAFLTRFNRAIIWMRDDGQIEAALRSCGIEDVRLFPGLPPDDWTRHASAYYLSCLGFEEAPPFRFVLEPAEHSFDVVIHPGSGGKAKNWPQERFESVAEMLAESGRAVTWVLGPAEEGFAPKGKADVLRADSLVELARVLTAAKLYIGNDSGITHLAAAAGCPTIAIFGPTDPDIWAPLGENVTVLRGDPWPSVDAVLACAEAQHRD
jgi:glycosyl transferase family 9 (putative heptosyltransferase)